MLETLANPVIPIFMAMVVGYLLRKVNILSAADATAINKFAFYLAVPTLIISVVGGAPLATFDWPAILVNLAVQLAVYAMVFAIMLYAFKIELREAMLLGMSAVIVNHIFFVLPIAERIYGPIAANPMAGIVMFDAGLIIPLSTILIAYLSIKSPKPADLYGIVLRNPFFYAPPIGIILAIVGDSAPAGIMTFAKFGGAAASPVLLFTLGITLAGSSLIRIGPAVWSVVAFKLLLVPALVYFGLMAFDVAEFDGTITFLVAAGPCGAMPFVVATQYDVETKRIAKAVAVSTILSVLSLSVLTS